jgi:hypothetical protein
MRDAIKFLLFISFIIFSFITKAQFIHQDTINAVPQRIPSLDTLFGNKDSARILVGDSLTRLQDEMFRKSFEYNKTQKLPKGNVITDTATQLYKTKKGKYKKIDTTHYSPKKAALWALACPGLGQIYNKKYWKLPIVYALMGTVIYFTAANAARLREYNGYLRNAYDSIPNPSPIDNLDISGIETYRNTYRRNVQLASFGTMLVWGLSIVDAVVDAHLHSFDISEKLSMKVKPQINSFDNSYYTGIALNLTFR